MATIAEEYEQAKREGRQPNCPYCGEPLEINETQYEHIRWRWDEEQGGYVKQDDDGDADRPYCASCHTEDWDFIDFDLVNF